MTARALDRLTAVLQSEEELYSGLRDLLQREHTLMAVLDADGLEEVARAKEELTDEGRLIEESRVAVTSELARELDCSDPRPRLCELCERLGAEGLALREAHTRLVVLVAVVQELMDANQALAGESLGQVQGTLRLLGGLVPNESLYQPDAARAHGGVGQLIRRTA